LFIQQFSTLDPESPPIRFTRHTVTTHDLPLLGPYVEPPRRRHRRRTSLSSASSFESDASDTESFFFVHDPQLIRSRQSRLIPRARLTTVTLPFLSLPPPISATMSSKIVAQYSGPVTANGLRVWLSSCQDGFDNYVDTHKDAELSTKTRIRLTGSALTEPAMAQWWVAGKEEYLKLVTWDAFALKVKARWLPIQWKMDALEAFYQCTQGKRDFESFATELATCINSLPSGTISVTTHKYHLLFLANQHLYLRVRALQDFDIEDTKQTPDELISLMNAHWKSMVAENSARGSRFITTAATSPAPSAPAAQPVALSTSTSSRYVPLTDEQKTTLNAAHGCWNCRRTPADPIWTPHTRHNCPGNPAIGARPGKDYVSVAPTTIVGAALLSSSPEPRDEDTESDSDVLSDGSSFEN
jgi:hypothetical protein